MNDIIADNIRYAGCYSASMSPNTTIKKAPASYTAHIQELIRRYEAALQHCKLKAILLANGQQLPVFMDDQHYPHKPNPHLLQWLPLFGIADSWLLYETGKKPRLILLLAADYWHATPDLPDESYLQHFEIEIYTEAKQANRVIAKLPRKTAVIDPTDAGKHANPERLVNFLHFHRSIKTAYEIDCIKAASQVAIPAHAAAKKAFDVGASGFEIHMEFMRAAGCSEHELPYPDIIACNENAAILHYELLTHEKNPQSLLIDAGTAMNGYASDITRTYSKDSAFNELIDSLEKLQLELCKEIVPGVSFGNAQHAAHLGIADILKQHGVVNMEPEAMIVEKVTNIFFPHGLGHMLGLQVHDMGGHMADTSGKKALAPKDHPNLRMSRTLQTGMVLTIEPGLYFVPMLLEQLRNTPESAYVDWARIEQLATNGGIRIEDNLSVTLDGAENLTRAAFSDYNQTETL